MEGEEKKFILKWDENILDEKFDLIRENDRNIIDQWQSISVKMMRDTFKVKQMIRLGIPYDLRRKIWKEFFEIEQDDLEYIQAFRRTFGEDDTIPKPFNIPNFDYEKRLDNEKNYLTDKGIHAAERVLCILSSEKPMLHYCPFLQDLGILNKKKRAL